MITLTVGKPGEGMTMWAPLDAMRAAYEAEAERCAQMMAKATTEKAREVFRRQRVSALRLRAAITPAVQGSLL